MNRAISHQVRENYPNASRYDWCSERRIRALGLRSDSNRTILLMRAHSTENTTMKHIKLTITFLALTAFAVGCKPSEEKATSQQIEQIAQETKEAAEEMKDYTYTQKAEFVENMRNQLAEINRDLDQLSAKVEKSSDAAKAEAKPKLQVLRDQTARLTKQLDDARSATESTWEDVKTGFKKGYSELKDSFNQTRQWMSDKIAP